MRPRSRPNYDVRVFGIEQIQVASKNQNLAAAAAEFLIWVYKTLCNVFDANSRMRFGILNQNTTIYIYISLYIYLSLYIYIYIQAFYLLIYSFIYLFFIYFCHSSTTIFTNKKMIFCIYYIDGRTDDDDKDGDEDG